MRPSRQLGSPADGTDILSRLTYEDIAESTAWLRGVLNETPTDRPGIHIGPPTDRLEIVFNRPERVRAISITGDLTGFSVIGKYQSGGGVILSSVVDEPSLLRIDVPEEGQTLSGICLSSAGQSLVKKIEIFRLGFNPDGGQGSRPPQTVLERITNGVIRQRDRDDAARIQRAIDELSAAGGGVFHIPEGTYLMSETIRVPRNVTVTPPENATIIGNVFENAPEPVRQLTVTPRGPSRQATVRGTDQFGNPVTETQSVPESMPEFLGGQCVFSDRVCWAHGDSCHHGANPSECNLGAIFRDIPEIMEAVENGRTMSRERVHELVLGYFNRYELHNPTSPEWRRTRDRQLAALSAVGPPLDICAACSNRRHDGTCARRGPRPTGRLQCRDYEPPSSRENPVVVNPTSHSRRRRPRRRRDWNRRRRRRLPPRDYHGRFSRPTPVVADGVGDSVPIAPAMGTREQLVATRELLNAARRRQMMSASADEALSVDPVTQEVFRTEPHIIEIPIRTNCPGRGTNMVVGEYVVPAGIEFMFTPQQKPLFRIKPLDAPEPDWKRRFRIQIDLMDAMQAQLRARVYNATLKDYENPQVPEDNHYRVMGRARAGDVIRVLVNNETENMRQFDIQVRLQATHLVRVSKRRGK